MSNDKEGNHQHLQKKDKQPQHWSLSFSKLNKQPVFEPTDKQRSEWTRKVTSLVQVPLKTHENLMNKLL